MAAKEAGRTTIQAEVRLGTHRGAVLHAVGANADHCLQRSNSDKLRAVTILLEDLEWSADREIARRAGVGNRLVSTMRGELSGNGYQIDAKVVRRGGTISTMQGIVEGRARATGW